jgi:hypothetical protein
MKQLSQFPLCPSVKELLCEVFRFFAKPPLSATDQFRPDLNYASRALCKVSILERFPAGQLDWEVSGLPRSYLLKVPAKQCLRLAYWVAAELKGFAPCFFAHVGIRRPPLFLLERESNRSYYRMAKSMELQPSIKGLITASWFHSPEIARVSPHLAWTNKVPLENGALVSTIGPADPSSGFLTGSQERRMLYESGEFKPTVGLVIWPRKRIIAWAASHPAIGC